LVALSVEGAILVEGLVRGRLIVADDQHLLIECGLPAFAVVLDVAHDELAGVVDRRFRHAHLLLV